MWGEAGAKESGREISGNRVGRRSRKFNLITRWRGVPVGGEAREGRDDLNFWMGKINIELDRMFSRRF